MSICCSVVPAEEENPPPALPPVAPPLDLGAPPYPKFPDNFPQGLDHLGQRLTILISGIWYLVFFIPSVFYLKVRPGPQPKSNIVWTGLKRIGVTIKHIRKLPNTFKYLCAYWILADGVAGISMMAPIFASTELGMDALELAIFLICIIVSAGTVMLWATISPIVALN
jgi:MFS-type transporter involved in bile tolerance (Atg22 family)